MTEQMEIIRQPVEGKDPGEDFHFQLERRDVQTESIGGFSRRMSDWLTSYTRSTLAFPHPDSTVILACGV